MKIAVLGGGPAGAAAALRLARGGAAVDLYMPAAPGEKPCGGAVPEHVLPLLAGFDPAPLPAVVSPHAVLENARRSRVELDLHDLRIFRRLDFDAALAAAAVAAGARRMAGRAGRVVAEAGGARGVLVTAAGVERRYDWAVGADGAGGLARRAAGVAPEGPGERSLGIGASLPLPEPVTPLVLAFPGAADSYLWIFPRPGGVSVGIAFTEGTLAEGAARELLDAFLDRHLGAAWRRCQAPCYRYPLPVYGPWTAATLRRGLDRRLLLAGDAASLADPLTREGIRYGLLAGTWAAECLLAGRPESYAERVDAELGEEMARAHRARNLFFAGPHLGQWMVPVARRHAGIRRVLGDLLACRQGYRGLRRRLLRAAVGRGELQGHR